MLCGLGVPSLRSLWGAVRNQQLYILRMYCKGSISFNFSIFFMIHTTYSKKKLHAFTTKKITRLDGFFVHDLHFSPHALPYSPFPSPLFLCTTLSLLGSAQSVTTGGCRLNYHRGKFLERDKFDVDKFGSPTSYQIFPSILRTRCVKGQQPSRGHQEITAAIHYEATARDLGNAMHAVRT